MATGKEADRKHPVDPELFRRTAPQWNCVDYPGDGMHYVSGNGDCRWCGMTRDQIRAEHSEQEREYQEMLTRAQEEKEQSEWRRGHDAT